MKKIFKLQQIALLAVFTVMAGLCSCNPDEVYEKEQYKYVFSIVSNDDGYNVFNDVLHLANRESECFVTASMGGSNYTTEDTEIQMIYDETLLTKFNEGNYGTTVAKYANILPKNMYDIDNRVTSASGITTYKLTIPAGATEGRLRIKIRPDGLCPDSIYMIPLKVLSFDKHEMHLKKNSILYRVMIKNKFATQEYTTAYKSVAQVGKYTDSMANVTINKPVHPLGKNKVRIIVGMRTFKSPPEAAIIENETITLTVNPDSSVTIAPYKNIEVEQVDDDPEYPNVFRIVREGTKYYKAFYINYQYTMDNQIWYVRERIRREFNPDTEKPEDLL
jgi:hypothetical protein